jgi:hypothetical protein
VALEKVGHVETEGPDDLLELAPGVALEEHAAIVALCEAQA